MASRLFPISVLAALTGACSFSAEADIPDVEITQNAVKMPGVSAKATGDISVSSRFSFTSSNSAWAKRLNSEVFVHRVTVAAGGGLSSLDFVAFARLTMADSASEGEPTEIINYDRCDQAPSSSVVDVSPQAPVDITQIWSAAQTVVELQMAGHLPEQDWTVSVTLKLAGKITYKF